MKIFKSVIVRILMFCFMQAMAEEKSIHSDDGVELAYSVQGEGAPVLVFVHGWCCDKSYWQAQIDHFSASHRVIAVDLAGHGDSGSNREAWSMQSFGSDVASVVLAEGPASVLLVGHSMGGSVILEAAARLRGSVIGLVGVDTYHNVEMALTEEQIEGFMAPFTADFVRATEGFVRGLFRGNADASLVDRVVGEMCSAIPEVGIAALRASFAYRAPGTIETLDFPVVALHSDLYPVNAEAFRRHSSSTFQVIMIEDSSHFPMLESPDAFNETLGQVIDGFIE